MANEVYKLGPFRPYALKVYRWMDGLDWRHLPNGGGLLDQNAALMDEIMKIKLANQISNELFDLQDEAEAQFDKLKNFSEDADRFNNKQRLIDERLGKNPHN